METTIHRQLDIQYHILQHSIFLGQKDLEEDLLGSPIPCLLLKLSFTPFL
jgi:hypothetical protein